MFFQIDVLAIIKENNAAKYRLYLPDGSTVIVYIALNEHHRLVSFGVVRMFDQPDTAGCIGSSDRYDVKTQEP